MTFDELNLNKPLLNALSDIGYFNPTPIQQEAFSVIMSGKDVVGLAQTGTGKTFAYLLPILRQMKFSKQLTPRVLIMVPTRELVIQVVGEVEKLCAYINLRVVGVFGGKGMHGQKLQVLDGMDILVATPGRLRDLTLQGSLKLRDVRQLVIDEVDEMLNLGFMPQLLRIFELLPSRRQNIMFSATLGDKIHDLINDYFNYPEKVEITPHGTPLEQIIQSAYHVPNFFTKINLLKILLSEDKSMDKVLVFVGTKKLADRVEEYISEAFPGEIGVIHSNKSQNFRINSIKRFYAGEYRILIATDVIARGLDISNVSHVINFNTPPVAIDYIHRIGRTGRADKTGIAITFITEKESEYQMAIETLMGKMIPMAESPKELIVSEELLPEEVETLAGDKHYRVEHTLKNSKGAFHEKKEKNMKVNRAGERRKARRLEKKQSTRKRRK